ncbi:MAG: histidinol dehydrogenase [Bacillota bacterium]|nr:histidinol dehydrogenase [Bacillota bacterium]MDW7685195.1 histidinol dehydrogenase [Bacillota bacterium]
MIQTYKLSEMQKDDIKRILKRSEVETAGVHELVKKIIEDVKTQGDPALVKYTKEFEDIVIQEDRVEVTKEEIAEAYRQVDADTVESIRVLADQVRRFHKAQLPEKMWSTELSPGLVAGQMVVPLQRVGCYVPGGRGWFPSAVMMTVLPAVVAGVAEVVVCTPATTGGIINPGTLVALDICGASRIFRIGGAQAIAAMTYGTQTVPKVEKIVGPGSKFVLASYQLLRGEVDFGPLAGPGEGLIVADESAKASWAAADVIIQCEHGTDAAGVLVTHVKELAEEVARLIPEHVERLAPRNREFVIESLRKFGAIIITESLQESLDFANEYAVEHLEIMTANPMLDMQKIRNAGGIYLGHYTPLSTGCFGSGPNHVLPTNRRAVLEGGLATHHFYKLVTFEYFSKDGLAHLRDHMVRLAEYEGFPAHGNAILERFKEE